MYKIHENVRQKAKLSLSRAIIAVHPVNLVAPIPV